MLNVRKCAVRQTVKSINMSTKRRQKSIKSESGSLSSKSQSRQSPQAPGSSNTGGTTSTSNEGCLKCGKDDDHSHLLLCEACNDEYHTHCLDPPLDYVPEGDFFCGKYFSVFQGRYCLQNYYCYCRALLLLYGTSTEMIIGKAASLSLRSI